MRKALFLALLILCACAQEPAQERVSIYSRDAEICRPAFVRPTKEEKVVFFANGFFRSPVSKEEKCYFEVRIVATYLPEGEEEALSVFARTIGPEKYKSQKYAPLLIAAKSKGDGDWDIRVIYHLKGASV